MRLAWVGVVVMWAGCGPRVVDQDTNGGGEGTAGSQTDPATSGSSSDPTQSDTSDSSSEETGPPDVCLGSCECTPSGALLWERVYPSGELEKVVGWNMALDADDNLVVVGSHVQYTPEDQTYGEESMWLALLDAEAAPIWSVAASSFPVSSPSQLGGGFGVHVEPDGRIFVVGSGEYVPGWSAAALRIFAPDGGLVDEIFDEPENGSVWWTVTTDDAGNAIVAGTEHTNGSGGSRAVLRMYSPLGDVLLDESFVGTAGEFMTNDAYGVGFRDGTIFVGGTLSNTHDYGEEDVWLAALESAGGIAWEGLYDSRSELLEYSDLGRDSGHGLALAPDGGVLVFGTHQVSKPTDTGTISTGERWARLYGSGGEPEWTWWRDDPVAVSGSARDATYDACGNAIIVGTEEVNDVDSLFVAKLSPAGALLWEQHGHRTPWNAGGIAVVARSDGSVVTLGNEDDGVLLLSAWSP